MTRTTVSRGIYQDRYGYTVRWRDHGQTRNQRFPLDTPVPVLKAFRDRRQLEAHPAPKDKTGSFVRDAVRFVKTRRGLASFKSDRAHLRPWIARFQNVSRWGITKDLVVFALREWQRAGYAPRTLRHRRRILDQLFRHLDTPSPCVGVKTPPPIKTRPRQIADTLITAVALQLARQEIAGKLRDGKTRARFLVLATTGIRPAQLKRSLPIDLDLDSRLWIVQPAKGDKGTVIYLNDEMLQAVQLFVRAHAWGWFDGRSFVHVLQRNGWPKGVRPYNVRHAVGQTLKRRGAPLSEIQDHLGHESPVTTSRHYLEPELAMLKATSERLSGRLGLEVFRDFHKKPDTTVTEENTNPRQTMPHSAPRPIGRSDRLPAGTSSKLA